jgi:acetylglutamate kinase
MNSYKEIIVVKLGGEVVDSKESLGDILGQVAKLVKENKKVVLVHGGGSQADSLANQMGHVPRKINGRRITTKKDQEIIKMLYGGSLNLDILSDLISFGLKGSRVSGLDGHFLKAVKRPVKEIDYGFVGDVVQTDPQILNLLLENRIIPVVSPLGCDDEGEILNINADTVAIETALSLQADKLILFSGIDGVLNGKGELLTKICLSDLKKMLSEDFIQGGMVVKLENCIRALQGGVGSIYITNGLKNNQALTLINRGKKIGTCLTVDN